MQALLDVAEIPCRIKRATQEATGGVYNLLFVKFVSFSVFSCLYVNLLLLLTCLGWLCYYNMLHMFSY